MAQPNFWHLKEPSPSYEIKRLNCSDIEIPSLPVLQRWNSVQWDPEGLFRNHNALCNLPRNSGASSDCLAHFPSTQLFQNLPHRRFSYSWEWPGKLQRFETEHPEVAWCKNLTLSSLDQIYGLSLWVMVYLKFVDWWGLGDPQRAGSSNFACSSPRFYPCPQAPLGVLQGVTSKIKNTKSHSIASQNVSLACIQSKFNPCHCIWPRA